MSSSSAVRPMPCPEPRPRPFTEEVAVGIGRHPFQTQGPSRVIATQLLQVVARLILNVLLADVLAVKTKADRPGIRCNREVISMEIVLTRPVVVIALHALIAPSAACPHHAD